MIHTLTEVDRLIELAIIQRAELKKLVDSLPELRTHLSIEIEKNVEQIEPHLRAELEVFLSARAKDENAKLGEMLQSKIETLCDDLETTTAAKYSAITLYKEKVIDLEKIAEKKITEAGERIGVEVPAQVEKLVEEKFARFPRAGEIDQLRKEFAEPKGLNPRGKWESGVTYYKLDLVAYNGDSYVANEETTQKPSRTSTKWTLNSARGAAGSGNNVSIAELISTPADGQILIGSNGGYVNADITAGDGIAISTAAGFIEISADGGTNYQGTWDAATNSPTLTSSVGTKGYYYVVNVDGSTNLNGITDWKVGDWAIYNGSVWQKVDNSESVTSVFGRVGSITAVAGDYSATQITNTAAGSITATNVQDAINELDGEKLAKASNLSDVASVTTSRTNLGVTATGADTTYAYRANNLNDLASITSARTNLGLGSAAVESATFFLQSANSLSDVASVALARTNLGLGSIATQSAGNVSITGGTITGITDLAIADGGTGASNTTDARTNLGLGSAAVQSATYFLQVANNLSDVASVALARTNLGLGNSATRDVGTTAGTVAAGDDARFTDSRTPTGPAGGDLTGTYPNPSLTISGVTAGGYGSASSAVVITLDSKGRAKEASAVNILIAESQVTNLVTDLASKIPSTEKGANSGVATLDSGGKIPLTQLPDSILGQVTYMGTWNASTNTPTLANPPATTTLGDYYIVTTGGTFASITFNVGDWIISNGADGWAKVDNTDAVASVFGRTGTVTATNGDYTASNITNVPAGGIVATEVQAAINELDGDKLAKASNLSDLVSFSTARTNLGLGSAATQADTYFLQVANNLSDLVSVTTARSNLALGSIATQNASNVSITGGSITGITDLAVADGGTGVSTSTGTTNVVLSHGPTIVTPVIATINDANGNETLKLASIASAVNEISIENAATGNPVHIRATGGDASVGLHLVAKGASGYVNVTDGVDETKRIMFNAAGGTTNTRTMLSSTQTVDRTISLPDATDTLVGKATTDTLTNKTLTSPTLTTPILGTPQSGTLTSCTGLPISTGVSGLGTGIATALAVNTGSAGAPVLFNGALGTPSSGTVTNLTGTASININGTVGATTANTGAFTTLSASGVASFSNGTNSAPALTFSSDTNTGFYRVGAGIIGITAGGLYAGNFQSNSAGGGLYIQAGGTNQNIRLVPSGTGSVLVDIGGTITSTSSTGFDVATSGVVRGSFTSTGLAVTGALSLSGAITMSGSPFGQGAGVRYISGAATSTDLYSNAATGGVHYWAIGESIKATLTGAGLGIGVTPVSNAGIVQLARTNSTGLSDIGSFGYGAAETYQWVIGPSTQSNNSGSGKMWRMRVDKPSTASQGSSFTLATYTGFDSSVDGNYVPSSSWSDRLVIDQIGNVGIGVTPSAWAAGSAAMQNSAGSIWRFGTTNIYLGQNYYYDGSNRVYSNSDAATEYQQGGGTHRWFTAASGTAGNAITFTERARITSAGDFMVGTTSTAPNAGMAFLSLDTTSSPRLLLGHPSTTASGNGYVEFLFNGTAIGSITQNGTTAVAYNTSSDYRLKDITGPLTDSGNFIDALKPKVGSWKSDGSKFVGFVAHEFAEVCPSAVTGKKDAVDADGKPKYQAMQASSAEVIANLVAELQSLRQRVAALESN